MNDGTIIRCMGVVHASMSVRSKCNACKRLPRNPSDENTGKWIAARWPCDSFIMADDKYLERHPV